MIPQAIITLKSALQCLSRDDLDKLSIEDLERIECDLQSWANLALVTVMAKRAAIRDEDKE